MFWLGLLNWTILHYKWVYGHNLPRYVVMNDDHLNHEVQFVLKEKGL